MKSQLFEERPKTIKTSAGRWIRVLPDNGLGYNMHDLVHGTAIGRLLVDEQGHWIYDGNILDIEEQEEVAGLTMGYQKEMAELLQTAGI